MKARDKWPGVVALAVAAALALAGCGGDGDDSGPAAAPTASASVVTAEPAPVTLPTIEPSPGWEAKIAKLAPNSGKVKNAGLSVQVVGDCASNNHAGMLLKVEGFPPNGYYYQQVIAPNGTAYTYLDPNGRFDKKGDASGWKWDCDDTGTSQPDQPGKYTLEFTDTTPGSPTQSVQVTVFFTVD